MSGAQYTNGNWSRLAELRPRLRPHVEIHRHTYRKRIWYVIQDHSSGRFHRFSAESNFLIGLMDGSKSLEEIREMAEAQWGADAPTREEIVDLVTKLQASDVLLVNQRVDSGELARRAVVRGRKQRLAYWRSPLALRIPLFDPERGLQRLSPLARLLFSGWGAILWLAVVGTALLQVGQHWPQLSDNVTERVLSVENLLLLALVFPLVKALHEFGHAFAVKAWGGEVHEMGIMFLVLMPVPYVDASSASAFVNKKRRITVGAAGMLVELFIASLAMFVWLLTEPGTVRSVAYNVMLIAGVSTVAFNANPLVRFDGYYVLMDYLEIPNLASRANRYLGYLVQRHVFGVSDSSSPVSARGEAPWFAFYSVASFVYRMFIMVVIISFVATKYFVIGIVLSLWALFSMLILPLYKSLRFLLLDSSLRSRRFRAMSASLVIVGGLAAFLLVAPLPYHTVSDGVVWFPDDAWIRAESEGFVTRVEIENGKEVREGDILIVMEDPVLSARVRVLDAQVREVETRLEAAVTMDRVLAASIREELALMRERLADAQRHERQLIVRSPGSGVFISAAVLRDMPGRFVRRGEPLGFVVGSRDWLVRAVVRQGDVELVRHESAAVEVRLADFGSRRFQASLRREVPGASDELPSMALSVGGGGNIALNPEPGEAPRAFRTLFQFDVALVDTMDTIRFGGRAYVRFQHAPRPLGSRWYRRLRQVLLRQFNV